MEKWSNLLHTTWADNTLLDYLYAVLTFLGLYLAFSIGKRILIKYISRVVKRTPTDFDDFLVDLFRNVGTWAFAILALYFATLSLNLPYFVHAGIRIATIIILSMRVIIMAQSILEYGILKTYRMRAPKGDNSVEGMSKSIASLAGIIVWGIGLIFMLDNVGINISALVAGIGIGGVAIALASQTILGDAFSALAIFFDRPFETGDFIIFDSYLGTVEHIGIKTTRIRSLWGEQLIVANSDITKARIKNFKRMNGRYTELSLKVDLQTPIEKARLIPDMIRDVFKAIPEFHPGRIDLKEINDYAFNFEFVFSYNSPDLDRFMTLQQDLYFKILERFQTEGIKLAYPTRTVFIPEKK